MPTQKDVTIGVTDNGPGIAPEHVKLIFDRFQQLPKDKADGKDGFGLGLHIASELVRVNFGTLSVESEPQKGSTFAFTIPVFDVNALIPLYFNFLSTARHSFQKVSIAVAAASGEMRERDACRCRALAAPAAPILRPAAAPARRELARLHRRRQRRTDQDHRADPRHLRRDQPQPPGRPAAGNSFPLRSDPGR